MNNDTFTSNNDYETLTHLIEGRELDPIQERQLTGLVTDIKELWLIAKMASVNSPDNNKKQQHTSS